VCFQNILSYLASNHLTDEGYFRNVSCRLIYISTLFIRYIIISVKTCQVTFHLCTVNFNFNKLVPIIEIRGSLESACSPGLQININMYRSYGFSQLDRMYIYAGTKHYANLSYDLILSERHAEYFNINQY
jgi:hypothetical protein